MSTSATATKHEWIVILPDQEGALERRMKLIKGSGRWEVGYTSLLRKCLNSRKAYMSTGAILDEPAKGGEGLKIKGSIMLALAETEAEVLQALKEDIYYKSDVWDWGKVQIYPFRSAVRKEL
ncbi:MAG: hypothetical protein M1837_003579 [Sclerophora amabilis]|nr:MAG: hypothetical protein M1837_003579 [Sclerophora amabilis]